MPYITLCSAKLSKRIQEINYSNDMLSHGISELEALYLRMQSGTGNDVETAKANEYVSLLNRRNHSLAHAINEALKEVESTLREQMETDMEMDKETIHEFTVVLRESIRIFHEYRLIQEGYQQRLQQSYKSSFYHFTNEKRHKDNRNVPIVQQFHRLVKSICVCGAGTNILH